MWALPLTKRKGASKPNDEAINLSLSLTSILCSLKLEVEETGATGVKTSELAKALQRLEADPYLALGLQPPQSSGAGKLSAANTTVGGDNSSAPITDADLKKAWRKMALKYG
jgi:hypothetical protein